MYYAKVVEGEVVQYPYNTADLRADHPNRSFSFPLSEASLIECNVVVVEPVEPPTPVFMTRTEEGLPELVEGTWRMVWNQVPLAGQEVADEVARTIDEYTNIVQMYMDQRAQEKGYDDIKSAALRAALPNSPFHAEGVLAGEWMDQCWATCYAILADVQSEQRPMPTVAELIDELPPFAWPV